MKRAPEVAIREVEHLGDVEGLLEVLKSERIALVVVAVGDVQRLVRARETDAHQPFERLEAPLGACERRPPPSTDLQVAHCVCACMLGLACARAIGVQERERASNQETIHKNRQT